MGFGNYNKYYHLILSFINVSELRLKSDFRFMAVFSYVVCGYSCVLGIITNPIIRGSVTMGEDRWYSVDEIAQHLGVQRETVYSWISKRGMPAHKIGRLWKFMKDEVDNWVRAGGASHQANQK